LGLNTVGLTRRGFEKKRIDEIHNIYRAIYQNSMNTTQALEYIEKEFKPSKDRDDILEFIRKSERGIIRGPR
jgi:UDP-N-acetylglucosamine acyltransferase